MEMKHTAVADQFRRSTSLLRNHPKGLLDTLTAIRWDLKHVLLEGVGCPKEMSTPIGRVFDDLDAAIYKLRNLIFESDLPV